MLLPPWPAPAGQHWTGRHPLAPSEIPQEAPRGVKRAPDTMRKPQKFRQQKAPPASPRLIPGQPLASTSESQVTRTNSGLAKTAQKSQRALLWLIS